MDGDEDLCADGRSRLAYRSRKTEKMTAKRRGKRLGAAEESGDLSRTVSEWRMVTAHKKESAHTRTHFTQPIENSIQDDEERQDLHDRKDRAADDKSED